MKVLVIDVGGTHVKVLATGRRTPVKIDSGPTMTPAAMSGAVKAATRGWSLDVIAIGYPGEVIRGHPLQTPPHSPSWTRTAGSSRSSTRPDAVDRAAAVLLRFPAPSGE